MAFAKRVLVVNLARRPDRLASVMQHLAASDIAHLSVYHLVARDGRKMPIAQLVTPQALDELETLASTGMRRFHAQLSTGAVGCYLSHVDAWRHIVEQGLADSDMDSPTLVLEDDAMPPVAMALGMDAGWQRAKAKAGSQPLLLLLHMICLKGCRLKRDGLMKPDLFWGTAAYMMNARDALAMLNTDLFPIDVQLDSKLRYLRNESKLSILYFPMIRDTSGGTDIQVSILLNAPVDRPTS